MKILCALLTICLSLNAWSAPLISDSLEENYLIIENLEERLDYAESIATPEGLAVLQTSRAMIANGDVVLGSCWDFINAVYNQAGFPSNQRMTAHKGKYAGPFASDEMIQPGDWLYFINHSFGDVEHSGIFIGWSDETHTEALVSSYAGGNKPVPGRYRLYDLSHVFNIIRGK